MSQPIQNNETFSSGIADANNYINWIISNFIPFIGDSLLEVGLGAGNFIDFLPEFKTYLGVDIDQELISFLKRQRPNNNYINCDIVSESFIENVGFEKYDTILCCNVLEHIENDLKAIQNLLSSLKSQGHLLLFVPALMLLYSDMDRLAGHYRRYNKKSLCALLSKCEASIKLIEYFNPLGALGWLAQKLIGVESLEDKSLNRRILIFDKYVVNLSKITNRLTKPFFGQSIIAVLEKN